QFAPIGFAGHPGRVHRGCCRPRPRTCPAGTAARCRARRLHTLLRPASGQPAGLPRALVGGRSVEPRRLWRLLDRRALDRLWPRLARPHRHPALGGHRDIPRMERQDGTHLPSPFWRKANTFRELLEFLLSYVATIKLAYNI